MCGLLLVRALALIPLHVLTHSVVLMRVLCVLLAWLSFTEQFSVQGDNMRAQAEFITQVICSNTAWASFQNIRRVFSK